MAPPHKPSKGGQQTTPNYVIVRHPHPCYSGYPTTAKRLIGVLVIRNPLLTAYVPKNVDEVYVATNNRYYLVTLPEGSHTLSNSDLKGQVEECVMSVLWAEPPFATELTPDQFQNYLRGAE